MSALRQRDEPIRSSKVLASARGETCTVRFPGICNGNPETTVFAHLNGAAYGKGMAQKAHDVLGFYACFACHTYYDVGHGTRPLISTDELLQCVLGAVCETWVRLIHAGIVFVPQDVAQPLHSQPTPARKPKAARKPVGPSPPMPGTRASGIQRRMDGTVTRKSEREAS